jgi:glutathione synthase/RimK-type ligase-like ATP-grasp enzyme
MSVLILADPTDPHTVVVTEQLSAKGCQFLVVDIGSSWQNTLLSLPLQEAEGLRFGGEVTQIESVWLRWKPQVGDVAAEEAFMLREKRDAIYGLVELCGAKNLLNNPWHQDKAKNKIIQLNLAQKCGLQTPRTWISNNTHDVVEGFDNNELIYKPITWLATSGGEMLFTNIVSRDVLLAHQKTIALAPGIFQNLVKKSCEYRVTIVDQQFFSVRIHLQETTESQIDWRRNQEKLRYEEVELPESLKAQLNELMASLQLRFAAVDLIESIDGEMVFLEANPVGNWLWLEEHLNLRISATIVDALTMNQNS